MLVYPSEPPKDYGERTISEKTPNITMIPLDLKHSVSDPSPKDIEAAQKALSEMTSLLASEKYDLMVLNKLLNAVHLGLISSFDLIAALKKRAEHIEVVLTSRELPDDIRNYADLVTKMKLIKHSSEKGIGARKSIEY